MPDHPSDWRTDIAKRVCELVRDDQVMARFRAMCLAFREEKRRDEQKLAAWERLRKEYCQRGLNTLDEFKARTAEMERLGNDRDAIEKTRPTEDTDKTLVYDYYQDHLDTDDADRLGDAKVAHMLVGFCAWVPPNLALANSPKLTVPDAFARFLGGWDLHSPPFGRLIEPGIASWAEKYATLAAIHDAQFPEREPIDQMSYIEHGLLTEEIRKRRRENNRETVSELADSAEPSIREWVADVEADLANSLGTPVTTTRKGGNQVGEDQFADRASNEAGRAQGDADKPPAEIRWLSRIADSIHELTRDGARKARFVQMVLSWAQRIARDGRWKGIRLTHFLRQEHPDWSDEEIDAEVAKTRRELGGIPFKFREDPIMVTIHAAIPLEKQYSDLAAIHDALHSCGYPISPWKVKPPTNPFRDDASDDEIEYYVAETCFKSLQESVASLANDDRPGIDRMVGDVSADLDRHLGLQDAEKAADLNATQPIALKRPSEDAFKAWRLRDLTGLRTQTDIAEEMSKQLKRKVTQGQVSRWLSDVEDYLKAGNIFPDLPGLSSEPQNIDPAVIDLGKREDRRTPHQRNRRKSDTAD